MNYATSGGGEIQVELQRENGTPVEGLALADCEPIFGDRIEGAVRWRGGKSPEALRGQTVRMRVRLRDAHLYAFRFKG